MSRIGRKEIELPDAVKVTFSNKELKVTGPKGELSQKVLDGIEFDIQEKQILVSRKGDTKSLKSLHGLYRSLLNNMIIGVEKGFTRRLELNGVGYRAQLKGSDVINFSVGYSHPVEFTVPKGVECQIVDNTKVVLTSHDKQLVGECAAKIRRIRPPEPYKKKGIKYAEEIIRGKAGKSAK
ncbi:MAG: 50S ribosomal protein L6 [Spirochaetota bacterium]|nr:50S ribosomal protein L6 [Spirochaetota bacterium]